MQQVEVSFRGSLPMCLDPVPRVFTPSRVFIQVASSLSCCLFVVGDEPLQSSEKDVELQPCEPDHRDKSVLPIHSRSPLVCLSVGVSIYLSAAVWAPTSSVMETA